MHHRLNKVESIIILRSLLLVQGLLVVTSRLLFAALGQIFLLSLTRRFFHRNERLRQRTGWLWMGDDVVVRLPLVSLPAHLEPLPHANSSPEPVPPSVSSPPSLSLPHTAISPSPSSHPLPSTMHGQRHGTYGNSAFPRAADSDEGTDSEESLFIQMKDGEEEEQKLGTNVTPHTFADHSTQSSHTHRSHLHPPPHTLSSSPPTCQHQESLSEDLVCMICACLLHDPMSLHCGHSFCNLCLAAMWQSAKEPGSAAGLHCPVCRASWRNFPAVNIQLRCVCVCVCVCVYVRTCVRVCV